MAMKLRLALLLAVIAFPALAHAEEKTTRVYIGAGRGVWLERFERGGWSPFCEAPCGREVPVSGLYRLAGRTLLLPDGQREVRLEPVVAEGGAYLRGGGYAMIVVGGLGTFVGLLLALSVQLSADGSCAPSCASEAASGRRITAGGLTAAGLGAAMVIAGIVMATRDSEVTVLMSRGAPFTWRF